MPQQHGDVIIQPPVGGVQKRTSFQTQPPFSSYASMNFWPVDPKTGRIATVTRPPMVAAPVPGGSVVNMIIPVNGFASGKPFQSMVGNFGGNLYWYNGTNWTAATGAQAGNVVNNQAVYGAPFLQQAFICNPLTKPVVFDYVAGTAELVSESAGTVPSDTRMAVTWQGALWLAGRLAEPQVLYASRTSDATDWDFGVAATDEGGAYASNSGADEGLLNGPITALMPQTADTMIVSTLEGLLAVRGHPRRGGIYDSLSRTTYVLGQGAWCKVPGDILFFMTPLGLMTLPPNPGAVPVQVSRESLPDELVGLIYTYENPVVSMEYDSRWNGIHIAVRGVEQQAWFYDLNLGGFHKMEFLGYPFVMFEFQPFISNTTNGVLYAGSAYGGLALMDVFGTEDFQASVTAGPIPMAASTQEQAKLTEFRLSFVRETPIAGTVGQLTIAAGVDGQDAVSRFELGRSQFTTDLRLLQQNNGLCFPSVTGNAFVFDLTVGGGADVGFENGASAIVTYGSNSRQRSEQVVSAGDPFDPAEPIDNEFDNTLWEGYSEGTPLAPGCTLTDYSMFVDLAQLPTSWWDRVSVSGGDIRITDDNNLEVPYDLIEFDHANQTGFLVLKVTQTIPARPVRIWSGSEIAAPYGEDDTFGQHNAYDSNWRGFWPSGGGDDRTAFGNDLTMVGATTGDTDGPVGNKATDYQDQTNWYGVTTVDIPTTHPVTIITAAFRDGSNNFLEDPVGLWNGLNTAILLSPRTVSTLAQTRIVSRSGGSDEFSTTGSGTAADQTWHHHTGAVGGASSRVAYIDAVASVENTDTLAVTGMVEFVVGKNGPSALSAASFDGRLSLVQLHDTARDACWVAYQNAMMDQGNFWDWGDFVEVNDPTEIPPQEPPPAVTNCPNGLESVTETGTWSGFAEATVDMSIPTRAPYTSHFIDLSLMPTEWWAAVRSDGQDVRATDKFNQFVPLDLVEFDKAAETGLAIVRTGLYFGSLFNTGEETFRLWVGNATAVAVPPCASYGQYRAYHPECIGFWPSGGGEDRTVFSNNLTAKATSGAAPTFGGVAGPIGNTATRYNGSTQYADYRFDKTTDKLFRLDLDSLGRAPVPTGQVFGFAKFVDQLGIDYGLSGGETTGWEPEWAFGFTSDNQNGRSNQVRGGIVYRPVEVTAEFVTSSGTAVARAISSAIADATIWLPYAGHANSLWSTEKSPTKYVIVDGVLHSPPADVIGSIFQPNLFTIGAFIDVAGGVSQFANADISMVGAYGSYDINPFSLQYMQRMMNQATFWGASGWTWTAQSNSLPQS